MAPELFSILHLSKLPASGSAAPGDDVAPGGFRFDTCQRTLWIAARPFASESLAALPQAQPLSGREAYDFLLRVATGLESQVKGETDVFGQLKKAWQEFSARPASEALVAELNPWLQKIFEDTKEIRSRFLRNVGQDSYGSLVRRMLRRYSDKGPVLLIGAGDIARAVAPWLVENGAGRERSLILWNRSRPALDALAQDLHDRAPDAQFETIAGSENEAAAWSRAQHVIVCIPADEAADARRAALFQSADLAATVADAPGAPEILDPREKSVIHLGVLSGGSPLAAAWQCVSHFHTLQDLFDLRQVQDRERSSLYLRATRACAERALLRFLTGSAGRGIGSVSLPHGWEDLSIFT